MKKIILVLIMIIMLVATTSCNKKYATTKIQYSRVVEISTYNETHLYTNCGYQILDNGCIRVYPFYNKKNTYDTSTYYDFYNSSFVIARGEGNED